MIGRIFALILLASTAQAGPEFIRDSVLTLRSDNQNFGGFSSIHVFDSGENILVVTDRGHFQPATLQRVDGRITGITFAAMTPVLDTKGQPLDSTNTDSEGLAIAPDGTIFLSFESNNRIMRHETLTAAAEFLPKHSDFNELQTNSGLEALAIGQNGTIYAMPERSGALDRPFPVYRFQNGQWDKTLEIRRAPPFLVVGADVFNGQLYVLERHLAGLAGFVTRIRRFDIGTALTNEQTLFTSKSGQFDNLEGISVWQDPTGAIRATLISDNNFNFFQRNQIVEFVLID